MSRSVGLIDMRRQVGVRTAVSSGGPPPPICTSTKLVSESDILALSVGNAIWNLYWCYVLSKLGQIGLTWKKGLGNEHGNDIFVTILQTSQTERLSYFCSQTKLPYIDE